MNSVFIKRLSLFVTILVIVLLLFAIPASAQAAEAENPQPSATELAAESLPTATPTSPYPPIDPLPENFEKNFSMPKKAPFSGRVAFTVKIAGYFRIFVLDIDSGRVKPLINGPGNNFYPTWSPDGESIVFVSDRDGNREIYTANWEGLEQKRITKSAADEGDPDWHPDGTKVVYYREIRTPKHTELFLTDVNTRKTQKLTALSGRNATPRFKPDGLQIAYSTNRFWPGWDVCIWDLSLHRESCVLDGDESFCRPAWSSTGRSLIYSYGKDNGINLGFSVLKKGSRNTALALNLREYDAHWINDNNHAIFTAEKVTPKNFDIYYFASKEPQGIPLLQSEYSIRYISWTPLSTFTLEARRIKARQAATPTPTSLAESSASPADNTLTPGT